MIYEELKNKYIDSGKIELLLKDSNISVLDGFLDNWETITKFNKSYYDRNLPKTVICGINPGKNGAGKTGIPFLDFTSLSKMIDSVDRQDTERSSQFFYDIVQEIGVKEFYKSFYVTNISWVGYISGNKNVNYYDLPLAAKEFVYDMFKYEMQLVNPSTIISLSGAVKETVLELFPRDEIDTDPQLPHPNYCAFPKNIENSKERYMSLLSQYIKAIQVA